MKIFISRIPELATRAEIKHLIEDELYSWFVLPFFPRPKLVKCEVLEITDRNGVTDFHGLVDVRPDRMAQRLIGRIKGHYLHGKRIDAHRYVERRSSRGGDGESDRRRSGLSIKKQITPHAEGFDQLVQKHTAL